MVDERLHRILTQYRESPNLLFMIRTYLERAQEAHERASELPEAFDLLSATGDQLTLLGKRLGWGRCHCVCDDQPLFGFDCGDEPQRVAGFCDESVSWVDCGASGFGLVCIQDDELYRSFLKVRRRQFAGQWDLAGLQQSVRDFWGDQARVMSYTDGRVTLAPGRELTEAETALVQLYPRVVPTPLGVITRIHFGDLNVFGFGDGWGGICDLGNPVNTEWLCGVDVRPYSC